MRGIEESGHLRRTDQEISLLDALMLQCLDGYLA